MNRKALIIGNQKYKEPKIAQLLSPEEDIPELQELLRSQDLLNSYTVQSHTNLSRKKMEKSIDLFFKKAESEDRLFFYFSGYGERNTDNSVYLYTHDTKTNNIRKSAYGFQDLLESAYKCNAAKIIIIIDCCTAGQHPLNFDFLLEDTQFKIETTKNKLGILTVTREQQFAYSKDKWLFTQFLIEGIKTKNADAKNKNQIILSDLCEYIKKHFNGFLMQIPVIKLYAADLSFIEYIGFSQSKEKPLAADEWKENFLIPAKNGWNKLSEGKEYSFLICYIDLKLDNKIKNDRDFWYEYILEPLSENDENKNWQSWIFSDFSTDKIFRCPFFTEVETTEQLGKFIKILLNKQYKDFQFNYLSKQVKIKIVFTINNIIYSQKSNQINEKINALYHTAANLKDDRLYIIGHALNYLPPKMQDKIDIINGSHQDNIYGLSLNN